MSIVVLKFGGTSVNTAEKRDKVIAKIIAAKEKGHQVVVVVSAMGRKGEPYATDTLLDLLSQIGPNPAESTKDLLVSCGEIISACVMAHALEQRGHKAVALTGFQAGIITDDNYTKADIKRVETDYLRKKLQEGKIVIVAGFQGITEQGEITTLGRGGSDTTALALGGALGAQEAVIYTDVPGVAWTDPRLVPGAPFLSTIGFQPMYTLARAGAKVIHLRAVKAAMDFACPFYIRSTFQEEEGTLIGQDGESFNGIYGLAVLNEVTLVKLPEVSDSARKLAVDELFCKEDGSGYSLVTAAPLSANELERIQGTATDGLALITMVWDSEKQIDAEQFITLLHGQGIELVDTFAVPCGGSYLVPAAQSDRAIRCLYNYSQRG